MVGCNSENYSESWRKLPWKKFQVSLFRLQRRVYKAIQVGDKRKAKSLQKLILKSRAARFLAIRKVTQLNQGKKTAGIDGRAKLNFKERFEIEPILQKFVNNWKHNKLREIPIPKKNGSTRKLKIPTILDRCEQGREEEVQRIAVNLLKEGLSFEVIAKATGLTVEQVQQLQQEITQAENQEE